MAQASDPLPCAAFERPPRALIFDMDGTIVDTRAFHMDAWRKLVAELGLSEAEYLVAERGFGKTNFAIFCEWYGEERARGEHDALTCRKEQCFRDLINGFVKARDGFYELLDAAEQRGIKIALCTSGPKENALFLLEELGVLDRFDAVIWGGGTGLGKPHPEPFLRAAAALNLPPEDCVGVEDSHHGLQSARDAGMQLVAIAETPADLDRHLSWTPWVFEDFRPLVGMLAATP